MENLIENPFKKKDEDDEEKKKRPVIKSATDLQRLKLEKLMKNPDKPIIIPEQPREKDYMQTVPSFVRNVMGSSAGAGSGEFHVYRHLRRKEYARQKCIQAKSIREQLDDEYQMKLEKNKLAAEAKTAKKRAKRLKKKQRAKKPKPVQSEQKDEEKDDTSEEEDDDEEEAPKAVQPSEKECSDNEQAVEIGAPNKADHDDSKNTAEDVEKQSTTDVPKKSDVGERAEELTMEAPEKESATDVPKRSDEGESETSAEDVTMEVPEKKLATDVPRKPTEDVTKGVPEKESSTDVPKKSAEDVTMDVPDKESTTDAAKKSDEGKSEKSGLAEKKSATDDSDEKKNITNPDKCEETTSAEVQESTVEPEK